MKTPWLSFLASRHLDVGGLLFLAAYMLRTGYLGVPPIHFAIVTAFTGWFAKREELIRARHALRGGF